jgi:beta-mannanase
MYTPELDIKSVLSLSKSKKIQWTQTFRVSLQQMLDFVTSPNGHGYLNRNRLDAIVSKSTRVRLYFRWFKSTSSSNLWWGSWSMNKWRPVNHLPEPPTLLTTASSKRQQWMNIPNACRLTSQMWNKETPRKQSVQHNNTVLGAVRRCSQA